MRLPIDRFQVRVAALAGAFAAISAPAFAHAGLKGVGEFWNGSLHLLLDPAQGLTLLGLSLGMARAHGREGNKRLSLAYPAALGAGLLLGLVAMPAGVESFSALPLAAAGILLLDPRGALGRRAAWSFGAGAFIAGLGFAAQIPAGIARFLFAAGSFGGGVILPLYPMALWERFHRPWFEAATRILGSWLTAIALMLFGASLR